MSLIRLTPGLQQGGGSFQKRRAELMGPRRHGEAQLQSLIYAFVVLVCWGRYREQFHSLPIQKQLQLMWRTQALNFLVAVARQPDLDFVVTVAGKRIANQRSTACANRQPFHVF